MSARIEDLSRPPVVSSPRPSRTNSPIAEAAPDVGERPHVDHRGPQLGQLPLGQLGVAPEERVRHDQAEHRVAEELQPLVGRQPAVLVRVRPVGQRPFQQARSIVTSSTSASRACRSFQSPTVGCALTQSDVEDLAAVVRAAGRAGDVRQLGLAAAVAGHESEPAPPSTAPVASGCCCATSSSWERPRVVSPRSVRAGRSGRAVVLGAGGQAAQGRPPGVDLVVPVVRVVGEPRTAVGAEPRAVLPAQRPQRQREHHRVAQRPVRGRSGHRSSPATGPCRRPRRARARGRRRALGGRPERTRRPGRGSARTPPTWCAATVAGHEHALDHRLEPQVQLELGPVRHAEHLDTQIGRCRHRSGERPHRPGRRPSSRVSSTRGDRGSRRVVALLLSSGIAHSGTVHSAPVGTASQGTRRAPRPEIVRRRCARPQPGWSLRSSG